VEIRLLTNMGHENADQPASAPAGSR